MWQLIKPWLADLYKQFFSTDSKRTGKIILTRLAVTRMHEYGLTEADVENAFRFGSEVKNGMLIQRFQTYQIGLIYKAADKPDEFVIITCWRR
jgi:hypothetical protein